MKIWLDDIRDAPDDTWTIVRTVDHAIIELAGAVIERNSPVEVMSFDHDLGEDHDTGYDLLRFLEGQAGRGRWELIPQSFQIHSANPVGRKNMQAAIDSIERMRNEA